MISWKYKKKNVPKDVALKLFKKLAIKHEIPPVLVLLHITICFFQSVVHFSGDFHVTFPYLFVVIFSQLSFILLVIFSQLSIILQAIFSQLSLIKHKIPPLLVLLHFIS